MKNGNTAAAEYVLDGIAVKSKPTLTAKQTGKDIVPDVTGMGARDAVYALESRGIKAIVKGRGKVKSQSLHAGTAVKQGMCCDLYLEN